MATAAEELVQHLVAQKSAQLSLPGAAPSLPFPPFSHRSSPTTTSSTPQVSPSKVAVNTEFLDIFQINVAVRMRLKSSNQLRQTAILIRDPLRQLLRCRGGGGGGAQQGVAALGAEAAQERILQASRPAAWGSGTPACQAACI